VFHETLNFAVVQRVPVVFVCENNLYSIHSPLSVRQPADVALHDRARSYGVPARQVDGNDVFAVHAAATEAVEWCRAGNGPAFVECLTYRWREHVGPLWDHDAGYRTKAEVDAWMRRCPVEHAIRVLRADGLVSDADLARWRVEIAAETSGAVAAAKSSPYPPVAELMVGTT
jgi:TPP-dependent pyruvate/acetoin dehydrogenase alpha subunit